jgi:hypothetical protein
VAYERPPPQEPFGPERGTFMRRAV